MQAPTSKREYIKSRQQFGERLFFGTFLVAVLLLTAVFVAIVGGGIWTTVGVFAVYAILGVGAAAILTALSRASGFSLSITKAVNTMAQAFDLPFTMNAPTAPTTDDSAPAAVETITLESSVAQPVTLQSLFVTMRDKGYTADDVARALTEDWESGRTWGLIGKPPAMREWEERLWSENEQRAATVNEKIEAARLETTQQRERAERAERTARQREEELTTALQKADPRPNIPLLDRATFLTTAFNRALSRVKVLEEQLASAQAEATDTKAGAGWAEIMDRVKVMAVWARLSSIHGGKLGVSAAREFWKSQGWAFPSAKEKYTAFSDLIQVLTFTVTSQPTLPHPDAATLLGDSYAQIVGEGDTNEGRGEDDTVNGDETTLPREEIGEVVNEETNGEPAESDDPTNAAEKRKDEILIPV